MIPKIVHFVYGLKEDFGNKPFCFPHWVAIKSFMRKNPDYKVFYWYRYLPDNKYFFDLQDDLTLMAVNPPTNIFGNPIFHVAHQADVVRLNALLKYGGFYLDIDTITCRSFNPLRYNSFIMAEELINGEVVGLCNAIMGGEPNAPFLKKWLESYQSFRSQGHDKFWNEHSVIIPKKLANENPTEITTLPSEAFFQPDYSKEGLKLMFNEKSDFPNAFAHHLWETLSWPILEQINEYNFNEIDITYTQIIKKILSNDIHKLKI